MFEGNWVCEKRQHVINHLYMSRNNMIIMFAKDVYYSTILYSTFVVLNAINLDIIGILIKCVYIIIRKLYCH